MVATASMVDKFEKKFAALTATESVDPQSAKISAQDRRLTKVLLPFVKHQRLAFLSIKKGLEK